MIFLTQTKREIEVSNIYPYSDFLIGETIERTGELVAVIIRKDNIACPIDPSWLLTYIRVAEKYRNEKNQQITDNWIAEILEVFKHSMRIGVFVSDYEIGVFNEYLEKYGVK